MVDEGIKAQRRPSADGANAQRFPALSLVAKAVLAAVLMAGAVTVATHALPIGVNQPHDDVSRSNAQARLEAFQALAPLDLSVVAPGDIDQALKDMKLESAAMAALKADLRAKTAPLSAEAAIAQRSAQPTAQPSAQVQRLRLVWITAWDTDAEDGDVVRIDSGGYSRTVRLTKHGDTFAVPVTADGVIRVTGIEDGDGGGITVGLASGSSRAIFPIMTEGQVLGLKVRIE